MSALPRVGGSGKRGQGIALVGERRSRANAALVAPWPGIRRDRLD
jgi:hypothetical protein